MKIFREVKDCRSWKRRKECEGIPDTEHLEKADRDESAKTGAAEVTADVSEKQKQMQRKLFQKKSRNSPVKMFKVKTEK